MGAKQGLEAGWWWEQRWGSVRRRGGLQQQQQAAFEGGPTYLHPRHRPGSRPRSPVRDKPTARRPPTGSGIDDPDPLGCGVA